MPVNFDHALNQSGLEGSRAALPAIFPHAAPASLLDVGCGTGTWLKAALEFGIPDVFGIDGVELSADTLHVPGTRVAKRDLTQPWTLERQFDAVLCLEVAEHLPPEHAGALVESLTRHAPLVIFSAACPDQAGQHHVNCQWPAYWQALFNRCGYRCDDPVRPRIWDDDRIEPWYRQNLFIARNDPSTAGTEPRVPAIVHPDTFRTALVASVAAGVEEGFTRVRDGRMTPGWYLAGFVNAATQKIRRALGQDRGARR